MSGDKTWLFYVALAGLAWGTYVPIIFYGGSEFGGKPNARMMAILCVGLAYFVIAVLFPLAMFLSGQELWPDMKTTGLVFAGLAGVAGAVGAICVIFASKSATAAAVEAGLPPASYRLYIAPLIFSLAPVINTIVSLTWHPEKGDPWHFVPPTFTSWKLPAGILLCAAGAFLVLMAKEESELPQKAPPAVAAPPDKAP
jgi:drug/metabolite transporter (DMT)-like permease